MVICGDLTSRVVGPCYAIVMAVAPPPKAVDGDGDDVCRLMCGHGLGQPGTQGTNTTDQP